MNTPVTLAMWMIIRLYARGSGQSWGARHGDGEDYFLQPGERFTVTLPGRVVVQGMLRS